MIWKRLSVIALSLGALLVLAPTGPAAGEKDGFTPLFNGKNLTGFYTYLKGHGKNKDPEKVFTVRDGMIRVSGQVWGCFTTDKEFENYHLVVEFKWGDKTWKPREGRARDSGVLLHCVGADGVAGGSWMESIECQIIEGGTGDFILVGGKGKPTMTAEVERRPTGSGSKKHQESYYKPGGTPTRFPPGRINWFGRDPEWKDVKGFRGKRDVEKPAGQWNRLECICDGDKITNILNGTVVNVGTKASHTRGKILFQSEGAEIFFRRIDIKPLRK
jgi:3-keto-disaccharide hydrolase